jgi:translation initiation factor 2 subunit 1
VKIRADVEVTCYSYEGIDSIKEALRAGQAIGTEDEPISIKLVAPPLYVMYVTCLDKDEGVKLLEKSIQVMKDKLTALHGDIVVKVAARSVTDRDDKELADMMKEIELQNSEVPGDDDVSDSDEE